MLCIDFGGVNPVSIYIDNFPNCVSMLALKKEIFDCFIMITEVTFFTARPVSL
jgi:hypothetical protein